MSKHIIDVFREVDNISKPDIIEPNEEAVDKYGQAYGCELLVVSQADLEALIDGKAWAFPVNGGEYKHFVVMG